MSVSVPHTKYGALEALTPSLPQVLRLKYGMSDRMGWSPKLRSRFNYVTPDDRYEAFLFDLIKPATAWLDVGCGRAIFPSNPQVAKLLSERCALLVGIDPSDNIDDNELVHQRAKCSIQEFDTDLKFDLITLRMVAEHIGDPKSAIESFARLTKPGGLVVIYTVWKWAPASIAAALTPMSVHHAVKRFLWDVQARDTFPVEYRMNTRATLNSLFQAGGFREECFHFLDDCRITQRSKIFNTAELLLWRMLQTVGIHYPERCILAAFRRLG